jgi:signal transduction histidine kinase
VSDRVGSGGFSAPMTDSSPMGRFTAALKRREAVLALLLALLLIIGAVAVVRTAKQARDDRARATASGDLAVAVAQAQADVTTLVDDARRLAAQVAASGAFVPGLATASSPVASGVGFVRVFGDGYSIAGDAPVTARALEGARAALDLARDTATPRALPALPVAGGGERPFVAGPAFRTRPDGIPALLETTDQRRADLLGFVLVGADLDGIAARATRAGSTVDVRVAGVADASAANYSTASATMTVAGAAWVVASAVGRPGALSAGDLALLVFAVLLAAAVFFGGVVTSRRRIAAQAAAASALVQLRLLTSLAPLVQETLDLGLLLPEIATRLRDELDLAGIGFGAPTPDGGFRDMYVLGSVEDVEPSSDLARSLGAGESAAIVMHRGGRVVGLLRVKPRRLLTVDELETLRGAAELATAAIVTGQLFEQQDEAMRGLREVDELKTAFLSTASHELRTPVAAIKGFATLLDDSWEGGTAADQHLFATRILANAKALDTLVQDLLDFSRLERGRVLVTPKPVDLTATTAQVLDRLSVIFADHQLATDLLPTPPVLADPEAVERILTNLTSNAVHYSPPGTTITVRTAPSDGGAELVVDDEGPGVPPAERGHVFSRFFRGAGNAVVRTRGTGIGLAVVKEYVDQLGGVVSVDRAPNGGARFRVWLAATEPGQDDR